MARELPDESTTDQHQELPADAGAPPNPAVLLPALLALGGLIVAIYTADPWLFALAAALGAGGTVTAALFAHQETR